MYKKNTLKTIRSGLIDLGVITNDFASDLNNTSGTAIPNIKAWVLENGFSIGTRGWDLICNLISVH